IMGSTVHFAYFGTKGDTTFPISLDPGTYDVALYQSGFAEGALIYKNIQVQGVTFDTLRVSDAVNTYTAEVRDEMGA
ncbi:MAG: hypothetical protein IIB09_06000, partial [Bacteroidetes bacterium]|nr:hypothetical protein [Bacteroidota bacterium]